MIFTYMLLFVTFGITTAEIPRANCNVNKTNFGTCLSTFFPKIFPELALEGIPDLGINPLDPLNIPLMPIEMKSKLIKGTLDLTDTTLVGLAKLKFKQIRLKQSSADNFKINVKVFIPKMDVEGDYDSNMTVANLDFAGRGHYTLKLGKLHVNVHVYEELYTKEEAYYFKTSKVSVHPRIGEFKLDATLDSNPKLAKVGVNMINTFWHMAFKQIYEFFAPHIEKIVIDQLNKYFEQVPIYSNPPSL